MPVVEKRSVLSGIPVSEAMRRQVIHLPRSADLGQAMRLMIRHKANAVLLTRQGVPSGVLSKTDILGAFYAELPADTRTGDVMGSQPIACFLDDPVEDALEIMVAAGVHRLYITGADREEVVGTVSYAEIVGLLYRYCRSCERGITKKRMGPAHIDASARYAVRDVMTPEVMACKGSDPLILVIETLTTQHMGAVLIEDRSQTPVGVISKTDLIIAYHHGVSPQAEARRVMSTPVHSVSDRALLSAAIQQMLTRDVQRLFVHPGDSGPHNISGVLALSDAARFRSGSCRACTAGRLLTS